jgi:4'-phosphopantetheinyl transferase
MVKDFNSSWLDGEPIALRLPRATASFANHAIEIVVTRLDVGPQAVRASAMLLSDAERHRAGRFAFDRDRRRFIVARAQLRRLLSARLGVRPEMVEFVYGAHGKPALARHFADSDLRFNVSHSDDFAVYAFAPVREIGVDVEAIRVIREADDMAAHFFSRSENEAYLALDASDKPLGFFNCWTRRKPSSRRSATACTIRWIASMSRSRRRNRPGSSASRARPGSTVAGRSIAFRPRLDSSVRSFYRSLLMSWRQR